MPNLILSCRMSTPIHYKLDKLSRLDISLLNLGAEALLVSQSSTTTLVFLFYRESRSYVFIVVRTKTFARKEAYLVLTVDQKKRSGAWWFSLLVSNFRGPSLLCFVHQARKCYCAIKLLVDALQNFLPSETGYSRILFS